MSGLSIQQGCGSNNISSFKPFCRDKYISFLIYRPIAQNRIFLDFPFISNTSEKKESEIHIPKGKILFTYMFQIITDFIFILVKKKINVCH